MEVHLLGYLYHDAMNHEIRAVDELAGGLRTVVGGTVFGPHPVVDGCLGLFNMQLARIAVSVFAAEVIDAIGDVAGLLNLSKEVACANSVQTTCGQEEKVALVCTRGQSPCAQDSCIFCLKISENEKILLNFADF